LIKIAQQHCKTEGEGFHLAALAHRPPSSPHLLLLSKFEFRIAGEIEADLRLRLASNRCVYGSPPAYGGRGAPAKHGHKLKLNDPDTWSLPTESVEVEDAKNWDECG